MPSQRMIYSSNIRSSPTSILRSLAIYSWLLSIIIFKYLRNKLIVITGASSGIGKGISLELLQKGYTIGISARRRERLEEIKKLDPKNVLIKEFDSSTEKNEELINFFIEKITILIWKVCWNEISVSDIFVIIITIQIVDYCYRVRK